MLPPDRNSDSLRSGFPAHDATGPLAARGNAVTVASVARAARGEPKAVDGSLASFLPRLPILPHVGGDGEWDEPHKLGHNGQFGP